MTYDVLKIHKEALTIRAYFLNNLLKTQHNNQILQLDQKNNLNCDVQKSQNLSKTTSEVERYMTRIRVGSCCTYHWLRQRMLLLDETLTCFIVSEYMSQWSVTRIVAWDIARR